MAVGIKTGAHGRIEGVMNEVEECNNDGGIKQFENNEVCKCYVAKQQGSCGKHDKQPDRYPEDFTPAEMEDLVWCLLNEAGLVAEIQQQQRKQYQHQAGGERRLPYR